MCDFGWYKSKQENASCTQCGMAKTVRKVTKERGSTNKASCVSKYIYPFAQELSYRYSVINTPFFIYNFT